jgi:hypothetical protein
MARLRRIFEGYGLWLEVEVKRVRAFTLMMCPLLGIRGEMLGFVRKTLIRRVNQLAQGYKKSTFHRYVPLHLSV